jgi:hypothetical protein
VNDCRDLELLLSLRASGAPDALDAAEAARLDAHLATREAVAGLHEDHGTAFDLVHGL